MREEQAQNGRLESLAQETITFAGDAAPLGFSPAQINSLGRLHQRESELSESLLINRRPGEAPLERHLRPGMQKPTVTDWMTTFVGITNGYG